MYNRLLFVFICIVLSFCLVQVPFAQESEDESVFIFEEEIGPDFKTDRNKENILYEKGKMTLMRFNSGKWFNDELSIFLKDIYPYFLDLDQRVEEE